MLNGYLKSDGKVYEIIGRDGAGRPVTRLTNLKDIPDDTPLNAPTETEEESVKPKRTRKK